MEGDRFIACHDAKLADENFKPRYASLSLHADFGGLRYRDAKFTFEWQSPNDLESIVKIPGKNLLLLCESGDSNGAPDTQMIFEAKVIRRSIRIIHAVPWPVPILNVEATAVAKLNEKFVFVFAERADTQSSTEWRWIELNPRTMVFADPIRPIRFQAPNPELDNRVIVGLDIGPLGVIYSVSAFDAEAAGLPDPDNGPFAAAIYEIGRISEVDGTPEITLYSEPTTLATKDGFKVESVAVRDLGDSAGIYFGTDDENDGGVLRPIPPPANP